MGIYDCSFITSFNCDIYYDGQVTILGSSKESLKVYFLVEEFG
jgi:putative transposon-encoded protein